MFSRHALPLAICVAACEPLLPFLLLEVPSEEVAEVYRSGIWLG
jgi:hypothetical protein